MEKAPPDPVAPSSAAQAAANAMRIALLLEAEQTRAEARRQRVRRFFIAILSSIIFVMIVLVLGKAFSLWRHL